jgi:hypothetical protein
MRRQARKSAEALNLDDFVTVAALSLYWAEGKKGSREVRIVNCDSDILVIFKQFLVDRLGVDVKRLGFRITCYEDGNIADIEKYWQETLQLSSSQQKKTLLLPVKNTSRSKRHPNGYCTVEICDYLLLEKIFGGIERLKART